MHCPECPHHVCRPSLPLDNIANTAITSSAMQTFCSLDHALDAVDRNSNEVTFKVPVTMKKVYEYENKTDTVVEIESKIMKGPLTREQEKESNKSGHNVGVIVKGGVHIRIVQLEVNANYSYSKEYYHEVMTDKKMKIGEEITTKWKVPPKSKLIRWQLVATLESEIIGFGKFVDTTDDLSKEMKESVFEGKAILHVPRKIIYDKTKFRIKHKETNKYLIPALKADNWESLTLKANPNYYFQLEKCSKGVRIKALNCTHPEYCYVYSNDPGEARLNKMANDDLSQIWIINQAGDIRDGDVVTFRSKKRETADLCHYEKQGEITNVWCSYNKETDWILEMDQFKSQ